jgi:hypothetical protein
MSETELALLNQVTRQFFSEGVTKFLRIAQLRPGLGDKIGSGQSYLSELPIEARE